MLKAEDGLQFYSPLFPFLLLLVGTQQTNEELPYPTMDTSTYSQNITTPYPEDATLERAD